MINELSSRDKAKINAAYNKLRDAHMEVLASLGRTTMSAAAEYIRKYPDSDVSFMVPTLALQVTEIAAIVCDDDSYAAYGYCHGIDNDDLLLIGRFPADQVVYYDT